jgi:hypothetical protein
VSISSRIELAANQITPSGDTVRIELIRPADNPLGSADHLAGRIKRHQCRATRPSELATAVVRIMAEAQARLRHPNSQIRSAIIGGHGSPQVPVKAAEHWIRVGWKRRRRAPTPYADSED